MLLVVLATEAVVLALLVVAAAADAIRMRFIPSKTRRKKGFFSPLFDCFLLIFFRLCAVAVVAVVEVVVLSVVELVVVVVIVNSNEVK